MSLGVECLEEYKEHRNHLGDSLLTKIVGRVDDINNIKNLLDNNDDVVIIGSSGIGKSRVAIAAVEDYCQEKDFVPLCLNTFGDYIQELDNIIEYEKKYLVFVDDANNFKKLIELYDYLNYKNRNNIKVVFTIRNYVRDIFDSIPNIKFYKLSKLNKDEIALAIKKNMNILNPDWLEQITRIANGNIRVAYLAAQKALIDPSGLSSLFNQTELISDFYKKEIFSMSKSKEMLICAGIVAFFNQININQLYYIVPILKCANINKETFIKNVDILASMDVIEEYKTIIKISDQCFADFLIDYIFANKKYIKLGDVLTIGYKYYRKEIINTINTILHIYYSEEFKAYLKQGVENACHSLETDVKVLHQLEADFVMIIPDIAISEYKNFIENYNDKKELDWAISLFQNAAYSNYCNIVTEGIFKLYKKTKKNQDLIDKSFEKIFYINMVNVKNKFEYVIIFLDNAQKYCYPEKKLYKFIAKYLGHSFVFYEYDDERSVNSYNIMINDYLENITTLRKKSWEILFAMDNEHIIKELINMGNNCNMKDCEQILRNDLECISKNKNNSDDFIILNNYLFFKLNNVCIQNTCDNPFIKDDEMYELITTIFKVVYDMNNIDRAIFVEKYYIKNKKNCIDAVIKIDNFMRNYFNYEYEIFLEYLLLCDRNYSKEAIEYFLSSILPASMVVDYLFKFMLNEKIYESILKINNSGRKDECLYAFYKNISLSDSSSIMEYPFVEWIKSNEDKGNKYSMYRDINDIKNIAEKNGISFVELIRIVYSKRLYNSFVAHCYLDAFFNNEGSAKVVMSIDNKLVENIYEFIISNNKYMARNGLKIILEEDISYCKKYAHNFMKNDFQTDIDSYIFTNNKFIKLFLDECLRNCNNESFVVQIKLSNIFKQNINNNYVYEYIYDYIENNYHNDKKMRIIFEAIDHIDFQKKKVLILQYLKKNANSEILDYIFTHRYESFSNATFYYEEENRKLEEIKNELMEWDYVRCISYIDKIIENNTKQIDYHNNNELYSIHDPMILKELSDADCRTDISLKEAYEVFLNDENFRKMLLSGCYKYKEGSFVDARNAPLQFKEIWKNRIIHVLNVKVDSSYFDHLSSLKAISKFMKKHANNLDDCLWEIFIEKKWSVEEFKNNTYLSRDIYSKIKNGNKQTMDKKTIIAILIGLQLPKSQRDYLLGLSNNSLSQYNEDDLIYEYLLDAKVDIEEADQLLIELGKPGLGIKKRKKE